jgi:hypothetical protein
MNPEYTVLGQHLQKRTSRSLRKWTINFLFENYRKQSSHQQ